MSRLDCSLCFDHVLYPPRVPLLQLQATTKTANWVRHGPYSSTTLVDKIIYCNRYCFCFFLRITA